MAADLGVFLRSTEGETGGFFGAWGVFGFQVGDASVDGVESEEGRCQELEEAGGESRHC